MEELTCPHCHKVSYSASSRVFSPCPYCKFRFAISDEGDKKYMVIDRQLDHVKGNYVESISESSDIEVIVDRRQAQRPFDGIDKRRVISTP